MNSTKPFVTCGSESLFGITIYRNSKTFTRVHFEFDFIDLDCPQQVFFFPQSYFEFDIGLN